MGYSVVWYSVVWHSVVWHSVVWHSVVWRSVVWRSVVWHSVVWYSVVWYSVVFTESSDKNGPQSAAMLAPRRGESVPTDSFDPWGQVGCRLPPESEVF